MHQTQSSTVAYDFRDASSASSDLLRDMPTDEFIAQVRHAYPTEREYDRMLSRKMTRRRDACAVTPSLESLGRCLRSFMDDHLAGFYDLADVRWLSGGASKIQVGFTLLHTPPGAATEERTHLVARMEPTESLNTTSRLREFQLLRAMSGVVPVPRTHWVDAEAEWFPEPTIIYEFVEGRTSPSAAASRVSGTGTRFPRELRESLGPEFVKLLADIHACDWSEHDLSAFDVPEVGTSQDARWQLNRARRVWEEDRGEDLPLVEVVANWLEDNLPALDTVSVVHGDFRTGNILFDEERRCITSCLDWERGYLGDRHRDLAWTTTRVFGNHSPDTGEFLVSGLMPEDEFIESYQDASGLTIDPDRMQ